jgi:hypothetical protein
MESSYELMDHPSNAAVFGQRATRRGEISRLVHMFKNSLPTFPQIHMPNGVAEWQKTTAARFEQAVKIAEDRADRAEDRNGN